MLKTKHERSIYMVQPINRANPVFSMSGVQQTQQADKSFGAISFHKSNQAQHQKKLNELLSKNNLNLEDRMPNEKSLAKLGFKKIDTIDRTNGQMYQDAKGNTICIGTWGADAESGIRGAKRVVYTSNDGIEQKVYYTPDGTPMMGKLTQKPTAPGSPCETFTYDIDESGNPVLKKYSSENGTFAPRGM